MNSSQRSVIVVGMLAVFGMLLMPPWKSRTYALIFDPPANTEIDLVRLMLQCALALVFAGAMFFALKTHGTQTDSIESLPSSKTNMLPIYVVSGFAVVALSLFGWHGFKQYQLQQAAREEIVEEEHRSIASAGRMVDAQDRAAAVATAISTQEEFTKKQNAKEWDDRLKKLASRKSWPTVSNLMPGIKANFYTHWKDDVLYYRFQISGSPADLEFATAKNHSFQIALKDTEGTDRFKMDIEPSQLRPYSNRSGAWSIMATDNAGQACSMEAYEGLAKWQLTGGS